MVDFKTMKKSANNFDKLRKELADQNQGKSKKEGEERFWSPTVDKAGNGFAIVRFLPAPGDEDLPFVRMWDHGFQGPGGWYIENSLTTIGKEDPVSEFNSELWNQSTDDNSPQRKQARTQKRRLSYTSNIYVVKDSAKPENEGKVFLYKYGKKIFDKLNDVMNPLEAEGEEAMNPFDLWTGANFKIKIRQVDGYRNYDKSEFDDAGPLLDDDKELEAIWKSEHPLQELIDPKHFKSYDELKKRLEKVLGLKTKGGMDEDVDAAESRKTAEPKKQKEAPAPKQKAAKAAKPPVEEDDESDDEDDEEGGLEYFSKLANEVDED
jgi:hypothetical protein